LISLVHKTFFSDSSNKHKDEGMNLLFEPRIHFTLHSGTKSSPFVAVFEPSTAETLLSFVTHIFLEKEIEVSFTKNYVVLPKVFQTYINDFGSLNEVLHWVCGFLTEEKAKLVKFVIKCEDCEIRFKEFDWSPAPPRILIL
jgi:hypothetical protein